MSNSALDNASLVNQVKLWTAMGLQRPASAAHPTVAPALHPAIHPALVLSESWPNRCWVDHKADTAALLSDPGFIDTITDIRQLPLPTLFTVWHHKPQSLKQSPAQGSEYNGQALRQALQAAGWRPAFMQESMIFNLALATLPKAGRLAVRPVSSPAELVDWVRLCSSASGDALDIQSIRQGMSDKQFVPLLAYPRGKPAATVLLYRSGDVLGISQLAVPGEHRGKGLGRNIMQVCMAAAKAQGVRYITLQASAAGKALFQSLGFNSQFMISNLTRLPAHRFKS